MVFKGFTHALVQRQYNYVCSAYANKNYVRVQSCTAVEQILQIYFEFWILCDVLDNPATAVTATLWLISTIYTLWIPLLSPSDWDANPQRILSTVSSLHSWKILTNTFLRRDICTLLFLCTSHLHNEQTKGNVRRWQATGDIENLSWQKRTIQFKRNRDDCQQAGSASHSKCPTYYTTKLTFRILTGSRAANYQRYESVVDRWFPGP